MPRKRARDEAELDASLLQNEEPKDRGLLWKLRNMWQFANFLQYLYFFGKIVKIDESIDMDDFEEICLSPDKVHKLADMGLALLKYVSSHRGLTPDIFDEYTRRQYLAKAPQRNPFGDEEEPKRFVDFDVFQKIKVLQQLSVWTLGNAERIRSQMAEKDSEQTQWRIEPFGWDSDDRTYFLLDDDRLYRLTDAPLPPTPTKAKAKSKTKSKPRTKGTRSSKRRKLSTSLSESEDEDAEDVTEVNGAENEQADEAREDDDFGGMKWECIAVTMEEYQSFLETIQKSRDPNEKALRKAIMESVMPILEKRAESQRQKLLKRQRDLENLQKMATAKRSSRLAGKAEKQREAEEAALAEEKRQAELVMAHKEQRRQQEMEEARESRMQTREQRLKEREVRRILHEEELAKLEEMRARGEDPESRHSSRHLNSELERKQRALEELKEEEEDEKWEFDCAGCGLHGENVDDGTHSIACERCNIWQHSKCNGIEEADAENDDFHFVCSDCKRKEEDAKKPRIPPLKLGRVSASPQLERPDTASSGNDNTLTPSKLGRTVTGVVIERASATAAAQQQNGDVLDAPVLAPYGGHTNGRADVGSPQEPWQGTVLPPPQRTAQSQQQIRETSGVQAPDAPPTPAHYQLHQSAHAQAVSASGLHDSTSTPHLNGQVQGISAASSASRPSQPVLQSPFMNTFSAQGTRTGQQGNLPGSPIKKQQTPSPSPPRFVDRSSPFQGGLSKPSPFHNLSPPRNSAQQQQVAGQSPTKQPSPSPQTVYRHYRPPQSSPSMPPPAATPAAQIVPPASSPAASLLRATPNVASSPIPPIGDGPVIPLKQDQDRPPSRDHAAEVPVFPPATSLSPSRLQDGKGMGTQAGQGGLGTGGIPVKKLPDQFSSPVQPGPGLFSSPVLGARNGSANGSVEREE